MPFLNLAPIPPKSNQIHNLIRQKNEENVRLPASPLTGRRPTANLEIGKCYNGGTTDGWGVAHAGPCWRATRFACFPNPVVHTPLTQKRVWKSNGLSWLHLVLGFSGQENLKHRHQESLVGVPLREAPLRHNWDSANPNTFSL